MCAISIDAIHFNIPLRALRHPPRPLPSPTFNAVRF
jgi:hypothetical protein